MNKQSESDGNGIPELDPEDDRRLQKAGMSPEEAFSLMSCIKEYHRALVLIGKYDEEKEDTSDSVEETQEEYPLRIEIVNLVIEELKSHLAKRGENVEHFGVANNGNIEQVVHNIYQEWEGEKLYPSLEIKAVNLFYLLIKDHLFVDGNKRIAAFLFLWFMDLNDILVIGGEDRTITYHLIYALSIFVAESNPTEKDIIIRLIHNVVMTHKKFVLDE